MTSSNDNQFVKFIFPSHLLDTVKELIRKSSAKELRDDNISYNIFAFIEKNKLALIVGTFFSDQINCEDYNPDSSYTIEIPPLRDLLNRDHEIVEIVEDTPLMENPLHFLYFIALLLGERYNAPDKAMSFDPPSHLN